MLIKEFLFLTDQPNLFFPLNWMDLLFNCVRYLWAFNSCSCCCCLCCCYCCCLPHGTGPLWGYPRAEAAVHTVRWIPANPVNKKVWNPFRRIKCIVLGGIPRLLSYFNPPYPNLSLSLTQESCFLDTPQKTCFRVNAFKTNIFRPSLDLNNFDRYNSTVRRQLVLTYSELLDLIIHYKLCTSTNNIKR